MSTWLRSAVVPKRDDLLDQAHRPLLDRRAQLPAQLPLARDPLGDRVAGPVRLERQAEQRLVEMDVAVDEAGNEQRAGEIDRGRVGVGSRARWIDRRDAAVARFRHRRAGRRTASRW